MSEPQHVEQTVDPDEDHNQLHEPLLTQHLEAPQQQQQQQQQGVPSDVGAAILAAHFLARWAWRSWEFSVALLLVHMYPGSLLLVAVYGLLDDLCSLALGPLAGQFVDRVPRLQAAITMYMAQNACILISAGSAALVLLSDSSAGNGSSMQELAWLKGLVVVAGACCSIGSMGATLSVEKDWAKTITAGDTAALSKLNAGLRAIDLSCQMLAPAAAGITMSYAGMLPAVVVMAAYAAAAWVPETLLLRFAHANCTRLRAPKASGPPAAPPSKLRLACKPCQALVSGWPVYYAQPTLAAAFALSMLYFTVLSLGFLMTSYLKSTGMAEATLSYFRGAGALSGLCGTLLFPLLQRKWGLRWTGLVGIIWQLAWLCGGVVPMVVSLKGHLPVGQQTLQLMLLTGLVASRSGLWLFDLAVGQLQQEAAAADELGVVAGAQGALQSLFEILSFVAGIAIPDPDHFYLLMLASLGPVASAAATYSWWCWRTSGLPKTTADCRSDGVPPSEQAEHEVEYD